jgi:hypothetical protein
MPPSTGIELGAILAIILAISPILKSLGDGISQWVQSWQKNKIDGADILSKNSLEWVERFSAELKEAKARIDALEAENKKLRQQQKEKDALHEDLASRVTAFEEKLNEWSRGIDILIEQIEKQEPPPAKWKKPKTGPLK